MPAIVRQLEAQGMEPCFDTNELAYNESISAFMKAGAATGRFVFILTEDYFKSPYCMIELLAIWRNCKWDAGTFQSRVRACVLDARIDTTEDRDRVRMH
ncbi:MAG: toll/interleukin-1 receptor domain-containing protein [Phycisphaerales bacterium]|nr:toll/interleukin-1 receptor domain-containing protein [Hyphomonadaceae bacterium]